MLDLIKNTVLASIGTAVVTKSKVHETMQYLVEQGKLTTEEAERLTKEMSEKGADELGEVRNQFYETLKKVISDMNVAKNKDLQDLNTRVQNLEKRVDILASRQGEQA